MFGWRRDRLGLEAEARDDRLVLEQVRRDHLDGHTAAERHVSGQVDRPHRPVPDSLENVELAGSGTGEAPRGDPLERSLRGDRHVIASGRSAVRAEVVAFLQRTTARRARRVLAREWGEGLGPGTGRPRHVGATTRTEAVARGDSTSTRLATVVPRHRRVRRSIDRRLRRIAPPRASDDPGVHSCP